MSLYYVETIPERKIIGIQTRTDNQKALIEIPILWQRFMKERILSQIPNKMNSEVLAVYTDYESDYTKPYSLILGCPVSTLENIPPGMVGKTISSSNYPVFPVQGKMEEAVGQKWMQIWQTQLSRKYTSDFESYEPQSFENGNMHIYIAIH